MTPSDLLEVMASLGYVLALRDGGLRLSGRGFPPLELLHQVETHRTALRELLIAETDPTLEALCSDMPPEEAEALREERAAILEHDAGLSRAEADQRARIAPRPP